MVQQIQILDQLILKKFQTDDKCRFFVGTTHTGGYGITLTAGSNMIYFSNGYDLEKDNNQKHVLIVLVKHKK